MDEYFFSNAVIGPVSTNCFIFGKKSEAIMLDPGGPEVLQIVKQLSKKGIEIKHIIATHGHFDHISWASDVIKECRNAKLYLSEAEKVYYEDYHNWMVRYGITPPEIAKPDIWFKDNEILDIGGLRIEVIHTPGHTPGSSVIYIEKFINGNDTVKVAFVGDLLFKGSVGRVDFPYSNADDMKLSLERIIEELDDDVLIYSGHGESTTMLSEKNANPYLLAIQKGIPIF